MENRLPTGEHNISRDDDDLSALPERNESTVLGHLRERFDAGTIYSYVGDILIAVNPCSPYPFYSEKHHELYNHVTRQSDLPPHTFAVAEYAYRCLQATASDQVAVISGESGAGKTETAKHLISHVLHICQSTQSGLGDQIVKMSPLLEYFGNATTVLNKNSSRFAKFLSLHFSAKGSIIGASLSHYLLEKSRVVFQNEGERNFHIFYLLVAGLPSSEKADLHLEDARRFRYLGDSIESIESEVPKLVADFGELAQAMAVLGFQDSDTNGLFSALAAILHIGNITFVDKNDKAKITNPDTLALVAKLLGVDSAQLLAALTVEIAVSRGETVRRSNSARKASEFRDAMAKMLYNCIFEWLVSFLNSALASTKLMSERRATLTVEAFTLMDQADDDAFGQASADIGILDIFGFENFQYNSFEQFCINIANEQLHFFINQHIFTWELAEYEKEGVQDTMGITFSSNKDTIKLFFAKPLGILSLLDDESKLQKATAIGLCEKFNQYCSEHDSYIKSKQQSRPLFSVNHYAGRVDYNASEFLTKNQDAISSCIINCLEESSTDFIRTLVDAQPMAPGKSGTEASRVAQVLMKCESPAQARVSVSQTSAAPKKTTLKSLRNSFRGESPAKAFDNSLSEQSQKKSVRKSTKQSLSKKASRKVAKNKNSGGQASTGSFSSGGLRRRRSTTIAHCFKISLGDLLNNMLVSSPHFIRCLKSNSQFTPNTFDDVTVKRQLRYTSVLDTCRIRQAGFPVRLSFSCFLSRYSHLVLTHKQVLLSSPNSACCETVLRKLELEDYALGHRKVFLRFYHAEILCNKLRQHINAAVLLQRCVRGFIARRLYRRMTPLVEREGCEQAAEESEQTAKEGAQMKLQEVVQNESKQRDQKETVHIESRHEPSQEQGIALKEPEQIAPEQKEPEQKESEQKEPEQKEPEQREPEQREPEQKESEQKEPEQKEPEQKESEQKEHEQKEPEQKESEQKEPEQKEPKQTAPEQKESEQKEHEQKEPEQKDSEQKEPEQKEPEQKEPEQKESEQKEPEQKESEQKDPEQTEEESEKRRLERELQEELEAIDRERAEREMERLEREREWELSEQHSEQEEAASHADEAARIRKHLSSPLDMRRAAQLAVRMSTKRRTPNRLRQHSMYDDCNSADHASDSDSGSFDSRRFSQPGTRREYQRSPLAVAKSQGTAPTVPEMGVSLIPNAANIVNKMPNKEYQSNVMSAVRLSDRGIMDTDEECNNALGHKPGLSVVSMGVDTDEECNRQQILETVTSPLGSRQCSPIPGDVIGADMLSPLVKRRDLLLTNEPADTDEECNSVQLKLDIISATSTPNSPFKQHEDLRPLTSRIRPSLDSDEELDVKIHKPHVKGKRTGSDATIKSEDWKKLGLFGQDEKARKRLMAEVKKFGDKPSTSHDDSKHTAKMRSKTDALGQEKERLQNEVFELTKLRDEIFLNKKIMEYMQMKREIEDMRTEALALRAEVNQMKVDVEDEMFRTSQLKTDAQQEIKMVLAMADRLALKPKAMEKTVPLLKVSKKPAQVEVKPAESVDKIDRTARPLASGFRTGSVPNFAVALGEGASPARNAQLIASKVVTSTPLQGANMYISLLDPSDRESIKCAQHILHSPHGRAVRQAMAAAQKSAERCSSPEAPYASVTGSKGCWSTSISTNSPVLPVFSSVSKCTPEKNEGERVLRSRSAIVIGANFASSSCERPPSPSIVVPASSSPECTAPPATPGVKRTASHVSSRASNGSLEAYLTAKDDDEPASTTSRFSFEGPASLTKHGSNGSLSDESLDAAELTNAREQQDVPLYLRQQRSASAVSPPTRKTPNLKRAQSCGLSRTTHKMCGGWTSIRRDPRKRDQAGKLSPLSPLSTSSRSAASDEPSDMSPSLTKRPDTEFPVPRPKEHLVDENAEVTAAEYSSCEPAEEEFRGLGAFLDEPWARLTCMELGAANGLYSVFSTRLVVDGSMCQRAQRLGLRALPVANGQSLVGEVRKYIGLGVAVDFRPDGCLYATRLTRNAVCVKGCSSPILNCIPPSVVQAKGRLIQNVPTKIYDIDLFRQHLVKLIRDDPLDHKAALSICKVALSFVHDKAQPESTPCWIILDIVPRHNDVTAILTLRPNALSIRAGAPWAAGSKIDPKMAFAGNKETLGNGTDDGAQGSKASLDKQRANSEVSFSSYDLSEIGELAVAGSTNDLSSVASSDLQVAASMDSSSLSQGACSQQTRSEIETVCAIGDDSNDQQTLHALAMSSTQSNATIRTKPHSSASLDSGSSITSVSKESILSPDVRKSFTKLVEEISTISGTSPTVSSSFSTADGTVPSQKLRNIKNSWVRALKTKK